MSKQVMQRALEALVAMQSYAAAEKCGLRICDAAIAELSAAIAAPEEEPVAMVSRSPNSVSVSWIGKTEWPNLTKLYTTPPDTEAMRKELERVKGESDVIKKALERLLTWPNPEGTIEAAYIPKWLAENCRAAIAAQGATP